MLGDSNFIIAVIFLLICFININKPLIAIAALICAGVAAMVLSQVLPVWANSVAAIAFLVFIAAAYLFGRR